MTDGTDNRVLLINGPPGAGKDYAAKVLMHYVPHSEFGGITHLLRFSDPLKDSICSWLGVRRGTPSEAKLEGTKDEPHPLLGHSYRQAQISLSEDHMKTKYGPYIFGDILVQRMKSLVERAPLLRHTFVVPDSGFRHEALPVVNCGLFKVALLQIHREGYDFSNDSRSYIEIPDVPLLTVSNCGTMEFDIRVGRAFDTWLQM